MEKIEVTHLLSIQKAETGGYSLHGDHFAVEADLILIPQNDYPRLFPSLTIVQSLEKMSKVHYGLLTSMLLIRGHTRF